MDGQAVRRRLKIITSHLAANEDISVTATHLFPMSCSNSLNSVIPRRDNKMYFSRQASSSQGGFMRQASNEQAKCVEPTFPFKPYNYFNMELKGSEVPMFSRPFGLQPNPQTSEEIQWLLQVSNNPQPSLEPPCFARPNRRDRDDSSFQPMEKNQPLKSICSQWSPKMDVAESTHRYIITVELPGVSISNIRVEVSDENLMVTGNRSIRVASFANEATNVAYHSQEITQGPYKIVWPLPTDVNKDEVLAEFSDGLLHIIVPKFSNPRQKTRDSM